MDVFIRTPFNYDRHAVSLETAIDCSEDVDHAQQQFKEECDINTIIERFGLAYQMPAGTRMPQYGDFTGIESYHDACNAIATAGESFDLLPASVRTRFQNDPGQFVDFMLNEKNRDEAIALGLIPKPSPVVSDVIPTPGFRADLPNGHPGNPASPAAPGPLTPAAGNAAPS